MHFKVNVKKHPYFSSQEFDRLQHRLREMGINPDKCIYIDIGHDGLRPFKGTNYRGTWGVWVCMKNVNPTVHYRYMSVQEVALWPTSSRKRADNVNPTINYSTSFRQLLQELHDLSHRDTPLTIYNGFTGSNMSLHVIIASIMCDSPGRAKVSSAGSANAYFPCQWCILQAECADGTGRTLYPAGYIQPMTTDLCEFVVDLVEPPSGRK